MNLLAHAYLSFDYDPFIIGNLISDFVKGKTKFLFSKEIQNGIMLHRAIDNYTDQHPEVSKAKEVFTSTVGLYAGAFVDISFDYFLANDSGIKSPLQWKVFTEKIYKTLNHHKEVLPKNFLRMLPYMIHEDWLYNYRHTWAINKSFNNIEKRAKFLPDKTNAFLAFENNLDFLQEKYSKFFPDLYHMAKDTAHKLKNDDIIT